MYVSRMAVVLWGSRTPGTAQIERDRAVTNNKKKVRNQKQTNFIK